MTKVLCFGTFDILHLGHLNYFQQAKQYGDYLIVVLARDKTKQAQNKTLVFNEEERKQLVQHVDLVDEVVLGDENDYFKIIEEKKPDIICLGYDHQIKENELKKELEKRDFYPEIKRMEAYRPETQKSTKIKEQVLNGS